MVIPDEGPYVPALPDDAGPHERQLHDIYGFSTGLVELTAEDWGKTADAVTGLALDVKGVVDALRGAQEPWEGPAAEAAFATLGKLRTSLEARSAEITDIKKGLEDAAAAADVARTQYATQVRAVSTHVDREGYQPTGGGNFNITAYEAAIEARREERESAAKSVLETFNASMGAAAKQLPVESTDDSVTIDTGGSMPPGGGNGPGGRGPGGGSYTPPDGGVWEQPRPPRNDDPPTTICPPPVDPPTPVVIECGPWPEPVDVDLNGNTTGTTTPTGPGNPEWAGTSPGGSSGGTGGIGLGTGAGAIGGGALAGGAAMLGKGMLGKLGGGALGAAGRGSIIAGGNTGAAARGSASARGGAAGAAGRGGMVAGGQGGAAGRGSAGGVRGAKAAGRYGVPKLGEGSRGGRGGVVAAGSGAGGRGGRKTKDGRAEGVDRLTHEDEETWFEGEDDATPPVWR
jgi:hypothetical protein